VHLDRWILGESERRPGVLGRFDLASIEDTFLRASARCRSELRSFSISLPAYSRLSKKRLASTYKLSLRPSTIAIWEGVVALEIADRLNKLESALAIRTQESERKVRFHEYDSYRGIAMANSLHSWIERQNDEHPLLKEKIFAAPNHFSLDGLMPRELWDVQG
jgi:uridine kinase